MDAMTCPTCTTRDRVMIERPFCSQRCRRAIRVYSIEPGLPGSVVAAVVTPDGKVYRPTDLR